MKGQRSYREVTGIAETGGWGTTGETEAEGTEVKEKRGAGKKHTALAEWQVEEEAAKWAGHGESGWRNKGVTEWRMVGEAKRI